MRSWLTAHPADLIARLFAAQSRALDAIARVPPLDRLPRRRLTLLVEGSCVLLLLAIGSTIDATAVWALLAIPMTLVVLLFLAEPELGPGAEIAPARRRPAPAAAPQPAEAPRTRVPAPGQIVIRRALPHRNGGDTQVRRGDATLTP